MSATIRQCVTGFVRDEGHNGSSGGKPELSKVTGRFVYRDFVGDDVRRVRPDVSILTFSSSARYLPPPCWSASITWSRLKLPTFWLGGNSLNVARNCPMYCCAGTSRKTRSIRQRP